MRLKTSFCFAALFTLIAGFALRGARSANPSYEWVSAGNLSTARAGACAAMLPDGRALITGGNGDAGALNTAEIHDVAGRTAAAAPMGTARAGHVCAALADGRVLVAGGRVDGGAATNSAEAYDPATESWTPVSAMLTARSGATASALADGRILIAGGKSGGASLASVEVFDAVLNAFRAARQTMSEPRSGHATAALPDGRVLLAGGADGDRSLDTVDVFDPVSMEVRPFGRLTVPRYELTATALLDGRVYFAGGANGRTELASTEIYDPADGRFSPAAPMTVARRGHAAVRIPDNNSVLLAGGAAEAGDELYAPWTNSYRRVTRSRQGRAGVSVISTRSGVVTLADGSSSKMQAQAVSAIAVATISTDKSDYAPGEQVTISGANWKAGEVITLQLSRSPSARNLQLSVTADSNGSFVYRPAELVMTAADLDQTYTMTASGNQGSSAQAIVFTDGSVSSVSVSVRQSNCTTGQTAFTIGATVCASSTVTINGSGTGDYRIQWYAPGFVPGTTAPLRDTLVANAPDQSTQTDSYTPPSTGTWTVIACKTGNPGPCSGGNVVNGTGTTFTVNPPPDSTPPVITPNVSGTLGNNGWYVGNVTVSWTVTDNESAVGTTTGCGTTVISTDTAGQTLTCSATSAGGSASNSVTVKRDATSPSITGSRSPAANGFGWNNSDVTVSFTCSDALSGLAAGSPPPNTVLSAEGANQSVNGTCTDIAGNSAPATVTGINIDKTGPTATAVASPAANSDGWNNSDVTVTFNATDAVSGIDTCSAPIVLSAEGTNQTAGPGTCTDKAGNTSSPVSKSGINIDKTAPVATASALPAPNGAGWNNTPVTVTFQGTDGLSGIASCTASAIVSVEGASVSSPPGTCIDKAGNTSSPVSKTGLKIDLTAPTITFGAASPGPNGFGWNNTNVSIPFTASDALSGVATTTPPSSPLTLSSEGAAVTGTVVVTDVAGNMTSAISPAVKIDKTPPAPPSAAITPPPNGAGWNNTLPVSVVFTGADALSGIASCTAPPAITAETPGTAVIGNCTDKAGNSGATTSVTVKVDTTAPGGPTNVLATPAAVGAPGTLTAALADPQNPNVASGIASAQFNVDGGSYSNMTAAAGSSFGNQSVNVTAVLPAFASTGVHTICVAGTDVAGNAGPASCAYYAVYDPSAGFVTGGGWINSPAGAYAADPGLVGKANFGFVSKYQKGADTPTGQTEFHFHAASFKFDSASYEWLVIAGAKAQYKGVGTVNGAGNYGFMLTAVDGSINGGGGTDKFRLKVWNIATGSIVYDNQLGADDGAAPTTALGGGSIVIHAGK